MPRPHSRWVAVALATLLSSNATPLRAQTLAAVPPSEVRTAAMAERSVRPDRATVTLTVSATGGTPRAAGLAVAARADSVRRALQALGVPRDSLVSGSQWYWWRGRLQMQVGEPRWVPAAREAGPGGSGRHVRDTTYLAQDVIEVRLHDVRTVGAAIDSAMARGVSQISPVRFFASDLTAAQDAALREATERARRQALAIAEASGGRLGRALLLSSEREGGDDYRAVVGLAGSTADSEAERATVIPAGIVVRVTVYGRWELLGRP